MLNGGLLTLKEDKRDLCLEKLGGLFVTAELPKKSFRVSTPLKIRNQGSDFTCTARAIVAMLEDTEKVELSEEYQWMLTAKLNKLDPKQMNQEGVDLRSAIKPAIKVGALERKYSPVTFQVDGVDKCISPASYDPIMQYNALIHRQKSYFRADNRKGTKDFFDSLVLSIYQTKKAVVFGTIFDNIWLGQTFIDTPTGNGYGHALKAFGYEIIGDKEYLVVQQSAGESIGEHGIQYLSRPVVNSGSAYGAFSFIDLTDSEVARLLKPSLFGKIKRFFAFI